MKAFQLSILLFLIALLFACQASSSQKNDLLYDKVLALHDTIMKDISLVENHQHSLRVVLEDLAEDNTASKTEVLNLLAALQSGHDAMFDWMNKFKNQHTDEEFYKNSPVDSIHLYLVQEEQKIIEVGKLMQSSIAAAQNYLNKSK